MLLTTQDLERLYGVRRRLVTALVRTGIVKPVRGDRAEYRFGFEDVLVVRMASEVTKAGVPVGRTLSFLRRLHQDEGHRLSALRVTTCGGEVVVRESGTIRNLAGQFLLDLGEATTTPAAMVNHLRKASSATMAATPAEYAAVALELEESDPDAAADLYRQAIALDDSYSCAYINLSCLLIGRGALEEATTVCRTGLEHCPESALLHFNLGVLYDDIGNKDGAMASYLAAVALEPGLADAHYNLHLLYEERGDSTDAIRHLAAYARLSGSL